LSGELKNALHVSDKERYTAFGDYKDKELTKYSGNSQNKDECFFFVGDNGQGDSIPAINGLRKNKKLAAAFLHTVTNNPTLKVKKRSDLFFFKTYAEAAQIAYENGFITKAGVQRVLAAMQTSSQWKMCVSCEKRKVHNSIKIENGDGCSLDSTTPKYWTKDGGCSDLFAGVQKVGKALGINIKQVPTLTKPKYESSVKRVLNKIFIKNNKHDSSSSWFFKRRIF